MNFQVAHMCIILHIDFVHIAFISILAVQGFCSYIYILNMAQWPGRLIYFQHAGAIIVILSNIRLPLAIAILIRQCDMINTENIGLAI